MKCPECGKEMDVVEKNVSRDTRVTPNRKYNRTLFHCRKDDVWASLETPAI